MADIQTNGDGTIKLPNALDLPAAQELVLTLRKALGTGTPVQIDASGVESVTLPCIQIVLAAIRSGTSVSIVDPSTTFTGVFMDLGLGWDRQPTNGAAGGAAEDERQAVQPAQGQDREPIDNAPRADDRPGADAPDSRSNGKAPAGKRILTIDDSKTMRDMLMLTLSNSGFDVVQAVDGQDGLDVLEKESVDVVITDINMPKMDGYGVIQNLRKNPIYDAMPILVLTTESDREKKERARALGATGFIVKPFNPVSLVEVIRKVSP